jgi:hypothetical protein
MLPSTKIYFMQDVKNDKVKKPSVLKPILEGVMFVSFFVVLVVVVYLGQEVVQFLNILVHSV